MAGNEFRVTPDATTTTLIAPRARRASAVAACRWVARSPGRFVRCSVPPWILLEVASTNLYTTCTR